jgi:hypothetical protein
LRGNCAAARFGDGRGLTPIDGVEADERAETLAKASGPLNEGAGGANERVDGGHRVWST